MHLAVVCQNVMRGEGHGRTNVEVALEALRRGHRLTIVADRLDDALAAHERVTWIHVPLARLPTQFLKDAAFVLRADAVLRGGAFDRVMTTGFVTTRPSDLCMVQFVHSAWRTSPYHVSRVTGGLYGAYQWAYSALNARLERLAFRRARVVVAVSHKIRRELEALGVPAGRIRVLHNGVDADEFRPGDADRSALGLPDAPVLALFAGDIRTPRKNLDTVLRALARVPRLHLAVAGRVEGSPFPALAGELGVADRVHFLDFRRDMPALMQAADLFVFPSRYEACTLVLLEAMATGLPVVTAATAGGAELVTDDAGFVLDDPDDVDTLAAHLAHLAGDADDRAAMGRAALAAAEGQSWRAMASRYLDLLEPAAVSSRSSRA